ncbi:hypothetical protein [Thermophilibacter sp.]
MRLCVCKLTALRVLRRLRASGERLPAARCDLPAPDPSPARRWTRRLLPLDRLALDGPPDERHPIDVAVPARESRVQARFVSNTLHSTELPPGSFVDLGDGLVIPCPELLFLELAGVMETEVLTLLGYELCGTYARDARSPRMGDVAYNVEPVTSVARLDAYLGSCRHVRGLVAARDALERVADDAWSPLEALVALMAVTPIDRYGYGLGPVRLNRRHANDPQLVAMGARATRVPDIEVVGTSVGFNYDSRDHFDLRSIAEAPPERTAAAMDAVRAKYRDDLGRNRELAAQGRIILPVTTEDLFAPGGLDAVMLEALLAVEKLDNRPIDPMVRALLSSDVLGWVRQLVIWSLLPWEPGARYAAELKAHRTSSKPKTYDAIVPF